MTTRTAVVVGSTGIIGRAIAAKLAELGGWRVLGIARSGETAPGVDEAIAVDLSDLEEARRRLAPAAAAYTGCVPGFMAGAFLVARGADGLYLMWTGDDRIGNQVIAYWAGQAGCTPSQVQTIVTVAEFAQLGAETWIMGRFGNGSFTCFVAGTEVVLQEDVGKTWAGLAGDEFSADAGAWEDLRTWVLEHRWIAGVGCLVAGLGISLAARMRRGRNRDREAMVDAALEQAEDVGWEGVTEPAHDWRADRHVRERRRCDAPSAI